MTDIVAEKLEQLDIDLGLKSSCKIQIVDLDIILSAKLTFSGNGGSCQHSDKYGDNKHEFYLGGRITRKFELKFVGGNKNSPKLGGDVTIKVDMMAGSQMKQTRFQADNLGHRCGSTPQETKRPSHHKLVLS
mmetsp:Transcript_41791/g.81926  ORF Transcript_41791/g.81926 Transcript_41791/m.81926 type:complete len:132 (+) Transcript_41791:716-1111(+)